MVRDGFHLSTDVPLPSKNCAGISNEKQLEIKCKGDKKDETPAFQLYEDRGEKRATDVAFPAWYPFFKCLERHEEIAVSRFLVGWMSECDRGGRVKCGLGC